MVRHVTGNLEWNFETVYNVHRDKRGLLLYLQAWDTWNVGQNQNQKQKITMKILKPENNKIGLRLWSLAGWVLRQTWCPPLSLLSPFWHSLGHVKFMWPKRTFKKRFLAGCWFYGYGIQSRDLNWKCGFGSHQHLSGESSRDSRWDHHAECEWSEKEEGLGTFRGWTGKKNHKVGKKE